MDTKCPECYGRSFEVADLGTASYRRCEDCGVDFMAGSEEFVEAMAEMSEDAE